MIIVCYVTFPNKQEADFISSKLLENKIIACYKLFLLKVAIIGNEMLKIEMK